MFFFNVFLLKCFRSVLDLAENALQKHSTNTDRSYLHFFKEHIFNSLFSNQ